MGKNYSTDSRDYRDWLDSALNDFLSTSAVYSGELYEQVCSLSYQSVEKSLKALLVYTQGSAPETHKLDFLYKICLKKNSKMSDFSGIPKQFGRFYFDVKYPSTNAPYIDDEVAYDLMVTAGQFYNFIEGLIEEMEYAKEEKYRQQYGKYKGHYLWDVAVDWYRLGTKKFHQTYGFRWQPHNDNLIKQAKEYVWYHYGLICD